MATKGLSKDEILEAIDQMTVLDLSDLVKAFEERYGVTAAAPVAVAAAPAAGGDGAAAAPAEEKTEFDAVLTEVGANKEYIESEVSTQLETIRQRRAQYTPVRAPIDPAARVVIVVDDGLATGSTMISALHALRAKNPAELICAVPVAPPDTLEKVHSNADRIVCLSAPVNFHAVGQFYRDFPQVTDEEVIAILAASGHPPAR